MSKEKTQTQKVKKIVRFLIEEKPTRKQVDRFYGSVIKWKGERYEQKN